MKFLKSLLLAGTAALCMAGAAHAQTLTLHQDLGNNIDSNTANLTASVNLPAGTTLLVLGEDGANTDVINSSAPTYNGVNMVPACKTGRTSGGSEWAYIWYLFSPATGAAHNLVITAPAQDVKAGVVAYSGVSSFESCTTKNTAAAGTVSTDTVVTQAANDLIVGLATGYTGQIVGSPFTLEAVDAEYSAWSLSDKVAATAGSYTATNSLNPGPNPVNQAVAVFSPTAPKITGVSLSKLTFPPNVANGVVGTLSATFSTGSPAVSYGISGTNSCGFQIVSSTTVEEINATTCNANTYNDFTITATCASCSPTTFAYGPTLEAQKVTDLVHFTTANTTFPAGQGNALIGTAAVVSITPTTPPALGVFSITGANSCNIHIVNNNQIQAQATGCAAGAYSDWNLVFTPQNTDIAAISLAEGATALAPDQYMLGSGTTNTRTLTPLANGCAQWDANGNPVAAVCPSVGPPGPIGPIGPTGAPGQNAGQVGTFTPASGTAPCTVGQSGFDGLWIYTCTQPNTWHRTSVGSTF